MLISIDNQLYVSEEHVGSSEFMEVYRMFGFDVHWLVESNLVTYVQCAGDDALDLDKITEACLAASIENKDICLYVGDIEQSEEETEYLKELSDKYNILFYIDSYEGFYVLGEDYVNIHESVTKRVTLPQGISNYGNLFVVYDRQVTIKNNTATFDNEWICMRTHNRKLIFIGCHIEVDGDLSSEVTIQAFHCTLVVNAFGVQTPLSLCDTYYGHAWSLDLMFDKTNLGCRVSVGSLTIYFDGAYKITENQYGEELEEGTSIEDYIDGGVIA